MDSNLSTYLSGFNGFGRSFNRSVLANDKGLHEEFKKALHNGSLPCNRLRILTMGDKGVGKSSTLQYLQGQACDPSTEPQATEGIEITICETSERKPSWKRRPDGVCHSADNPCLSAAWSICSSGVDSMGGVLHKGLPNNDSGTQQESLRKGLFKRRVKKSPPVKISTRQRLQGLQKIGLRLIYQFKLSAPSVVLFLLLSYTQFLNDFGVLCWLSIFFSVPFFGMDFNSSYRFITSVAVQLLCVDVALSVKEYVLGRGEYLELVLMALILYFGVCAMSFLFGVLCGFGCRTGLAVAFSLMTHKFLLHVNIKTAAALIIGNLLGVLLMRDAFSHLRSIPRRPRQFLLLCVLAIAAGFGGNFQLLVGHMANLCLADVLVGIVMGFGYPYGVLKGREIIAVRKLWWPYLLKKGIGFVLAMAIGHVVGWKLLVSSVTSTWPAIACSVLAACGFPVYDWIVAQRVKQLERDGIPITTFMRYLIDSASQDNPVSLKLYFWDNAGDTVYRTMQQFFRPAEAVYLLVFSLKDAQENVVRQLECLRQWLSSVKAHSKKPNTMVFVVGTHRDSVSEEFITSIAVKINEQLYTDFCSILAINGDKGPLYVLENSKPLDKDGLKLRQSIIRIAKMTPFMNELFPIRHLNILNKIQKMQFELPWIMSTSELLAEIGEDMTLVELQKILTSLHNTGDVIYRQDDNILKKFVILEPQSLVDVMKTIVCIPERGSRKLSEAEDWNTLEVKGIASLKLIKVVVGCETLIPCVLRLMEAYDLLIPIYSATDELSPDESLHDQDQVKDDPPCQTESSSFSQDLPSCCIIPSHLPEFAGDNQDFFEPGDEDEEFYFDFGYVAPDPIFHRLLSKCWCNRDTNERVFKTRGQFRYRGLIFYTIQLLKVSVSQNTIQVIILHDGHNRCTLQVLQFLQDLLEKIRRSDFPNLPYSCGPICHSCSTADCLKVLKVCGDDKELPTANLPFESFMSKGKYHEVQLTPQLKVKCGRRTRSSSSTSIVDSRQCEDPVPMNHISVAEQSHRVTVITGGNNSRFDIYSPKSLPNEGGNLTE